MRRRRRKVIRIRKKKKKKNNDKKKKEERQKKQAAGTNVIEEDGETRRVQGKAFSNFIREGARPDEAQECDGLPDCATYDYVVGEWGDCTEPCGMGEQLRGVQCMRTDTLVPIPVDHQLCTGQGLAAVPTASQVCNSAPCEFFWWATEKWAACSASCPASCSSHSPET